VLPAALVAAEGGRESCSWSLSRTWSPRVCLAGREREEFSLEAGEFRFEEPVELQRLPRGLIHSLGQATQRRESLLVRTEQVWNAQVQSTASVLRLLSCGEELFGSGERALQGRHRLGLEVRFQRERRGADDLLTAPVQLVLRPWRRGRLLAELSQHALEIAAPLLDRGGDQVIAHAVLEELREEFAREVLGDAGVREVQELALRPHVIPAALLHAERLGAGLRLEALARAAAPPDERPPRQAVGAAVRGAP